MAKWPTTKRKVVTLLATLCLFYLLWKEWNVFCYIPRSIIISYYYLSLFDFVFVIYIIYLVIRLDIYIRIYAKNNWTMNYFLWLHFCKDSLWPSYLPSEIIFVFEKNGKQVLEYIMNIVAFSRCNIAIENIRHNLTYLILTNDSIIIFNVVFFTDEEKISNGKEKKKFDGNT